MNGHEWKGEWKGGWMNWIIFEIWEALSRMYRPTTPIFENHTRWNKDLFGKLLTRCSRVTSFCTGQTSKFQQEFVHLFWPCFRMKVIRCTQNLPVVCSILMAFCRNFVKHFRDRKNIEICSNFANLAKNVSWNFRNGIKFSSFSPLMHSPS